MDAYSCPPTGGAIVPRSEGDLLHAASLDEAMELDDALAADALSGGKASKDALNSFPFNSSSGGQSMLNLYSGRVTDLDSKLRSDVLVGEQGSSEETGLMTPSVELDSLQVRSSLSPFLFSVKRQQGAYCSHSQLLAA